MNVSHIPVATAKLQNRILASNGVFPKKVISQRVEYVTSVHGRI